MPLSPVVSGFRFSEVSMIRDPALEALRGDWSADSAMNLGGGWQPTQPRLVRQ